MEPAQPAPHPDHVVERSHLDFPVVGIGASAGGIAACRRLLEQMPKEPDMALVVVLHLSPRHESTAAEILQTATGMPVRQVLQTTAIERNTVYVIPPTQDLTMSDGKLVLADAVRPVGRHVVIDGFFRTLADAHRDRAVGIVLSGTGSDGAAGIGWLKQSGGVVIAQSPEDAEHDGMPVAAIATGHVDIVLPAADIAQRLADLWSNAQQIEIPNAAAADVRAREPSAPEAAEEALREVMKIVRQRTGHDFKHYKRATLLRRLERRLQVNGVPTLPAYRALLANSLDEPRLLLADLLIGVTQFFRDRVAFESLEREVLPRIFQEAGDQEQIRAWIAGCSTGEEAYSMAMLFADEAKRSRTARRITLFATDIDEPSLETAREGRYPESIVADVPPTRLRGHFNKEGGVWRIAKALRDLIVFAPHNVLRDPPFSRLDLVSCRNLLIYLDRSAQRDVLQMFHFALKPGGFLFLGSSETVDASGELFSPVDKANRIYRANAVARNLRVLPQFTHTDRLTAPAHATANTPRALKLAELHQRMLSEVGAATVVLTAANEILHSSSRVGDYLRFAEGTPSTDVLSVAPPELRQALRVCLFEALQSRGHAESAPTPMARDGKRVFARVARDLGAPGDLILLTFDELSEAQVAPREASEGRDPMYAQLEGELLKRTEQLQTTIEQYETSAEELKASNEELQAINEELRAASEELETSKEELQSTNEELTTVNVELKSKVEETSIINDDLTNLISVTEIATVFVDERMRIKLFTPAASGIFSLLRSDIGRTLFDLTHKLDYPALAADAENVFKTLKPVEREVKSADDRWFLARLFPYRTGTDRISGVVLTFVDISNRLSGRADDAMKSEFLAVMSHELKHPLNLINVNAELLAQLPETRGSERLVRAVQTIQRTVKGQARIIDDLLDLSRANTGKLALQVAPLLVSDAIAPAIASAEASAREKGIAFVGEGLDRPLLIEGDPMRIEQIAWNLLSNALKFSRPGGTITVRLDQEGDEVVLEVRDTGRGIAAGFLPQVFEMFRQGESATRRQEGGLGIGLALVRNLVELHGGSVDTHSAGAGRGATFRVRLPMRERSDFTPLAQAEPAAGQLAGVRVLLVDDTEDTLETFGALLEAEGALVTPASSGLKALEAADTDHFDLVISDIAMPLMDGYQLIAELRARPQTADLPAIALTGFGRPQDVRQALSAGFSAHLDKPVDFQEMRRLFERLHIGRA